MSRRALRESERAHAQATLSDTGETATTEPPVDQQIWPQPLAAEPLDYSTQTRRPTPIDEPPLRRTRSSGSSPSAPETPSYRVRDFSPEGRGTSFSSTAPAPWTPPAAGSGDLDYHTSVEFNRAAPTAFDADETVPPKLVTPVAPVAPLISEPAAGQPAQSIEHTLTRRELRELRNASRPEVIDGAPQQEQAAARRAAPVADSVPRPDPVPPLDSAESLPTLLLPRPEQSAELAAAMAEFDALMLAKSPPPLVEPGRSSSGVSAPAAPPAEAQPSAARPTQASAAPAPEPFIPVQPAATATPVIPPIATAAPAESPIAPPPQAPETPEAQAEPLREIVTAPEVYAAPAGHWSVQLNSDEQYADTVGLHSRDIAASDAITTNALVLTALPQTGPLTGPVSRTGEILLTGSIDLPRSLGLNGWNPGRYDRADIDAVIDAGDREDSAPDSAPVRAIRAVSTHTSSQGIINTKRPKGSSLPMILSITAGVMAVGVIVLFVAGMIFKIF